jgi:hypothetical protein
MLGWLIRPEAQHIACPNMKIKINSPWKTRQPF